MAFEGLSSRLQEITRKLSGKARITESDLKEVLREVKLALLEADVNYKIVKDFTKVVEEKALGQDVLKSLTPGQQVVKVVRDELINLLGGEDSKVTFMPNPPTIIMLVGLQGSGKTTTAGKLANLFRKQGKKPILVGLDIYRPAAIKQLQVVGKQLDIPVYVNENEKVVTRIAKQAKEIAISKMCDTIILDTAGRLQIDEKLMQELKDLKSEIKPHEILLVVDSMTGQDAVNVAQTFNENVGIDGIVLTKLDGDTRGGAALSVKKITNRPIKFIANGEKLSDIEEFHPDRMAQRILGMGDVLSLIEKAEETFDIEETEKLQKRLRKQKFDLNDYLAQLKQIKKMGSISSLLKMIPGLNKLKDVEVDEKEFVRIEAMINSMTEEERSNPKILNGSRRLRIANGSGTTVQQINKFMNSFEMTQKMMKQMTSNKGAMRKMMKNMNLDDLNTGDLDLEKMDLKDLGIDLKNLKK
jgi:signal recognition particle subunit SRP54